MALFVWFGMSDQLKVCVSFMCPLTSMQLQFSKRGVLAYTICANNMVLRLIQKTEQEFDDTGLSCVGNSGWKRCTVHNIAI